MQDIPERAYGNSTPIIILIFLQAAYFVWMVQEWLGGEENFSTYIEERFLKICGI